MKFTREQYLELMTFGDFERPMFVELFGPLIGLPEEWRAQGASEEEIAMVAFDWDYVPIVSPGAHTGFRGGSEPVILEEDDEYRIERDRLGRTMKLPKKSATIALPLDFPVKDMDSWLEIKPMLTFHEDRIDWDQVERAKIEQSEGALVVAHIPGGFDTPRELMGDAGACLCYYENPELMHDILATLADTAMRVLESISDAIVIDQLSVHEDLAGKSGPLIGPKQVEEFIKPYFRPIWEMLSAKGTRIFDMDTDGNPLPVLDAFMECGLNSMHPMEPAAGVDIVKIREEYGERLMMRGGIDKFALLKGKEAIRAELEYKMQPIMKDAGGIAFGLDHRIVNGTPLENYRYYVETGREILGLPPLSSELQGWRRMAF
jgi:hypothetical protein